MLSCLVLPFFALQWIYIASSASWVARGSPSLPNAAYATAAGVYNNTITLIGGRDQYTLDPSRDLTEFNTLTQSIVDFRSGSRALPVEIYGYSQYWAQYGNILYLLQPFTSYIHFYDLASNIFTVNWRTTVPFNTTGSGCLAASANALYVIGGGTGYTKGTTHHCSDRLQIYELTIDTWTQGPPMQQARTELACAVSPRSNELYAIGGFSTTNAAGETRTVEYISLSSIASNQWQYTSNDLSDYQLGGLSAAVYGKRIYVVGGYNAGSYYSLLHVIDTQTKLVTRSTADNLAFPVHHAAAITAGRRLYAFGGYMHAPDLSSSEGVTNAWQYYDLPTLEPTSNPTATTLNPSYDPTRSPSAPTQNPTKEPTGRPTTDATKNPSMPPTPNPTDYPSSSPTRDPSQSATFDPTEEPSVHPSMAPSLSPTRSDSASYASSQSVSRMWVAFDVVIALCILWLLASIAYKCYQRYLMHFAQARKQETVELVASELLQGKEKDAGSSEKRGEFVLLHQGDGMTERQSV